MSYTLAATAGLLAMTVFFGWRGARPIDLRRGPRMIPWRWLMLFSATGVFLLFIHLLNLAGFATGRP